MKVEPTPDTHAAAVSAVAHVARPKLWVADDRQRVGKTVLLNTAMQYFRALGSQAAARSADRQNQSRSLSTFTPTHLCRRR